MLNNKTILITGGTGSFGQKFTEIVLKRYDPEKLIIFSRDEVKQHEMQQKGFNQKNLRYFIGDIRDKERLERALDGVDIVIHAAALKQVPMCEYNPFEAVKTNILGTQNIINASIDKGVEKVVALSSDKAVNPVNVYGATKLCAEKIIVQGNSYVGKYATRFSSVRYGNVVASRGSVIPAFLEQKKKGILTITDKRMTRFWITLEQGVNFVIKCIEIMQGGEIFVPKIPSMKIVDLASAMAPGCRLEEAGIRPGEKLNESLITEEESRHTLECGDFYVIEPKFPWWHAENCKGSKKVLDGFRYRSDLNKKWLTKEELLKLIEEKGENVDKSAYVSHG